MRYESLSYVKGFELRERRAKEKAEGEFDHEKNLMCTRIKIM